MSQLCNINNIYNHFQFIIILSTCWWQHFYILYCPSIFTRWNSRLCHLQIYPNISPNISKRVSSSPLFALETILFLHHLLKTRLGIKIICCQKHVATNYIWTFTSVNNLIDFSLNFLSLPTFLVNCILSTVTFKVFYL